MKLAEIKRVPALFFANINYCFSRDKYIASSTNIELIIM